MPAIEFLISTIKVPPKIATDIAFQSIYGKINNILGVIKSLKVSIKSCLKFYFCISSSGLSIPISLSSSSPAYLMFTFIGFLNRKNERHPTREIADMTM